MLPRQLTSFIGRQRELDELTRLVSARKLVTLTGPGGCGKTRLALEAAHTLRATFPDAVWFVDLASVREPAEIAATVLRALELTPASGRAAEEMLGAWVETRDALILLDNCEHLVDGCAALVHSLLQRDARACVLATSREPLRVSGEQRFVLAPLPIGDDTTHDGDAVRLFADRATLVAPHFELANNPLVARICRRLDGLPLAIELAAARLSAYSLEEIEAGLDRRFALLRTGSRTADARHRTMEAALDWSYQLLDAAEQRALRWLSVYPGGFTTGAAEEVLKSFGDPGALLTNLVEKSFVVRDGDIAAHETRFRLLESVRQFAAERLAASGEVRAARDAHLGRVLALAARGEQERRGPRELEWLDRLDAEREDLRAALAWCAERGAGGMGGAGTDGGEREPQETTAEIQLRLAADLAWFWYFRGSRDEGKRWLTEALTSSGAQTTARARALMWVASMGVQTGDPTAMHMEQAEEAVAIGRRAGEPRVLVEALGYQTQVSHFLSCAMPGTDGPSVSMDERTAASYHECVSLAREIGDAWLVARALCFGPGPWYWPPAEAEPVVEEAVRCARLSGDTHLLAVALRLRGIVAMRAGDFARAVEAHRGELELMHKRRDPAGVHVAYVNCAAAAVRLREYDDAQQLLEACLAHDRAVLARPGITGQALDLLGLLSLQKHAPQDAGRVFREALTLYRASNRARRLPWSLTGLSAAAWAQGDHTLAATLHGAAARWTTSRPLMMRVPAYGMDDLYEAHLADLRERLHEPALALARSAGEAMSLDDAVALALAQAGQPPLQDGNRRPRTREKGDLLSPRERQVAALVARGLTNREIAAELVVTEHTAMRHVEHILAKLGLRSRTQIAAWAVEHTLAHQMPIGEVTNRR